MKDQHALCRLAMRAMTGDYYMHSTTAFIRDAVEWLARELGQIRIDAEGEGFAVTTDEQDAWSGKIWDERLDVCLATAIVEVERRRNPFFAPMAETFYRKAAMAGT